MIEAVIFDMDGLLLDSEPFWKITETEVFNSLGVPLTFEMSDTTVGMRIEEVSVYWHSKYLWDLSLNGQSFKDVNQRVIDRVIELINEKGAPFDGVDYILRFFNERRLKMAVASSSAMRIIDAVLDKFRIRHYFNAIVSAETEEFGKPHPAIYLKAASTLSVEPKNCLAFEDSYNGLKSAKSAGMKTVVIPEERYYNESKFDEADIKLKRLTCFTDEILKQFN